MVRKYEFPHQKYSIREEIIFRHQNGKKAHTLGDESLIFPLKVSIFGEEIAFSRQK